MIGIALAFDTALAFWSNPLLPVSLPTMGKRDAARVLSRAGGAVHVNDLDRLTGHPLFERLPPQLDVLVPRAGDHRRTKQATLHAWTGSLPPNALCQPEGISPSLPADFAVAISSPEFTFLQMAQVMGDLELAELAMELCGTYAIAPGAPGGLMHRDPVTTPDRLQAFLARAEGAPGVQRARRAARTAIAGSRSPRESQLALLACMPRCKGGAGLPKPIMNPRLKAKGGAARVADASWISPDLYWPQAKLVLEYDSRSFHEGMTPAEHDSRKRNVYTLMGLDVIDLTPGQFADQAALYSLFADVARRCGIRRSRPTPRMLLARADAHAFMMAGARRERWCDPMACQGE